MQIFVYIKKYNVLIYVKKEIILRARKEICKKIFVLYVSIYILNWS